MHESFFKRLKRNFCLCVGFAYSRKNAVILNQSTLFFATIGKNSYFSLDSF